MSARQRASSGSPFEAQFGFCRAVRTGNRIVVAGTGPIEDDGKTTPGGAAEQAERCLTLIVRAIEQLGGLASDVVRTRMLLTDFDDQAAVGERPSNLKEVVSQLKQQPGVLSYQESKTLLQGYGIKVPHDVMVYTAEEALAAARKIGYPLAMKSRNRGRGNSRRLTFQSLHYTQSRG